MSYPYYDKKREIWICQVLKAKKDNPAVKKGQPYIWAKRDAFSQKRYFKNFEELNKIFPEKTFEDYYKKELKLLRAYHKELKQRPKLKPLTFLKDYVKVSISKHTKD